jgi:hypothetical protein
MMNCASVQENLSAFIYGELNAEETMSLHRHLSRCKKCTGEEMELKKTVRLLNRNFSLELPPDFEQKLAHKLDKVKAISFYKTNQLRRIVWAVAATFILTIGVELFTYYFIISSANHRDLARFEPQQSLFNGHKAKTPLYNNVQDKFLGRLASKFQFVRSHAEKNNGSAPIMRNQPELHISPR